MSKKNKIALIAILVLGVLFLAAAYLRSHNVQVLNPKGLIALKERGLMITVTLLMLIVVIPVFVMTFFIAWKYRESNTKAKYSPELDHNSVAEFTWWAIPCVLILVIGIITWQSSHELDPYKSLVSSAQPITIQVVALPWKWLFIYPEQNIATVNFVEFPQNTPVGFEVTSDAPMNSFWIPQLGGQIYAMAGMRTNLHLMASGTGSYNGSSANLSGKGFAGMKFIAKSVSSGDFNQWLATVATTGGRLGLEQYTQLAKPSENNQVTYYSSEENGLYDWIISKYMMPGSSTQ
jgi:cytochrome o ubiquinol oxidase subunit 2